MSYNPGTNQACLLPSLSLRVPALRSETMDPVTRVEYGRVQAGAAFNAAITPATELPVSW